MSRTAPTLTTRAPAQDPKNWVIGAEELRAVPTATLLDSHVITEWIGRLATFNRDVPDAERIDQIRALEQVKAAAAAAQARITVDLDSSVRAAHAAAGLPVDRQGCGVAAQVALAAPDRPSRSGCRWRST